MPRIGLAEIAEPSTQALMRHGAAEWIAAEAPWRSVGTFAGAI